ncbi:MAG: pentapeptide repeat-containing protein [Streptosporangiaceae bacterium]
MRVNTRTALSDADLTDADLSDADLTRAAYSEDRPRPCGMGPRP